MASKAKGLATKQAMFARQSGGAGTSSPRTVVRPRHRSVIAELVCAEVFNDVDLVAQILVQLGMQASHQLASTSPTFLAALKAMQLRLRALHPVPVARLGAKGGPSGGEKKLGLMKCPTHMVALPNGGMAVADSDNNRIQIWNRHGRATSSISCADTGIRNPRGLAADGESLYVADCANHRVLRLRLEGGLLGEQLAETGGQGSDRGCFSHPEGICVRGSSLLFVADKDNNRVVALGATDLAWLWSVGTFGTGPHNLMYPTSLCVCGDELFVCDHYNHRVQVYSTRGLLRRSICGFGAGHGPGRFQFPFCVTADAQGKLLVSETKRLVVLARDGSLLQVLPLPDCNALAGVIATTSHVYVADSSANTLLQLQRVP
tara:strand:- start:1871 stop:2995 length:1125 start_codon:yes stop_codon:yes gene_type:complete